MINPMFGCVVLTDGSKPERLQAALASLLRQTGVEADVAVVGNGWEPSGIPDGVRTVHLPVDRGIPEGRNAGAAQVAGEVLLFLDDDVELQADDALARLAAMFAAEARLGMVQLHVEPSVPGGARSREWIPRLRSGDPWRSSPITVVWEGAVAVRRDVFEAAGRWPSGLRFMHEGIALGWSVMDEGYAVRYAGDVVALHPSPEDAGRPSSHPYHAYGARNRVLLARRHLRFPFNALFVAAFMARTAPKLLRGGTRREVIAGYREGARMDAGERRPLKAATIWRMFLAGRPPIM